MTKMSGLGKVLDALFGGNVSEEEVTLKDGEEKVEQIKLINIEPNRDQPRKNFDEEFKQKASEITLYIQQKKEPYFSAYKKIREISVKEIKKNYKELNANFDLFLGESDAETYIEKTIKIFEDKKLAYESEGALIVDVAKDGENMPSDKLDENGQPYLLNPMPPVILKKQNGADVYATTDIATILMRNETIKDLDEIIYVVDGR